MIGTPIDRVGQRFTRLVVIERAPNKGGIKSWRCRCDCGTFVEVRANSLTQGNTKSCGCLNREMPRGVPAHNLTGHRVGRLMALSRAPNLGIKVRWFCHCDCGVFCVVNAAHLLSATTNSCGCLRREMRRTHGQTGSRTYHTWANMIRRCTKPRATGYSDYGGRGIRVCERWLKFENFLADMGERPTNKTLDRWPNNDGNYELANCRWATAQEQQSNKRPPKKRVFFCKRQHALIGDNLLPGTRSCKECARIHARIRLGWPEELACSMKGDQRFGPKKYIGSKKNLKHVASPPSV